MECKLVKLFYTVAGVPWSRAAKTFFFDERSTTAKKF